MKTRIRWEEQGDGVLKHYRPPVRYRGLLANITITPEAEKYILEITALTSGVSMLKVTCPSVNVAKREARRIMEQEHDFDKAGEGQV